MRLSSEVSVATLGVARQPQQYSISFDFCQRLTGKKNEREERKQGKTRGQESEGKRKGEKANRWVRRKKKKKAAVGIDSKILGETNVNWREGTAKQVAGKGKQCG